MKFYNRTNEIAELQRIKEMAFTKAELLAIYLR
jgi:hypothetical protein